MLLGLAAEVVHGVSRPGSSRGFTVPAVAGLALAIGATTAVFSAYYAMLLRPLGFSGTDSLVTLWQTDAAHGQAQVEICYEDYLAWRKQAPQLLDVALASSVNLDFPITSGGQPQLVDGTTVTGN